MPSLKFERLDRPRDAGCQVKFWRKQLPDVPIRSRLAPPGRPHDAL